MPISDSNPSNTNFRESEAYQDALRFLYSRIDYERVPKMPYAQKDLNLARMRRLLELLGDPQRNSRIIHIAGTKGKGSTTSLLSAAFAAANLRCASYTSPHLHFFEERFSLNNEACDPEVLIELLKPVRVAAEQMDGDSLGSPTFFEIATAIAFLFFQHHNVDVAILEVGLGGRLDSTNVCDPLVAVITSISFDHTKQLGNTLALIAGEKAGIIKHGVPIVSGAQHPEAASVIESVAHDHDAPLYRLRHEFDYRNYVPHRSDAEQARADFLLPSPTGTSSDGPRELMGVDVRLPGEHQAANAAVALAAMSCLPEDLQLSEEAIRTGFSQARCAARIEVVSRKPLTIIDAAHNVASIEALVDVLQTTYADHPMLLVMGATRGKDVEGMLERLLPQFCQIVCTQYESNPRAVDAEKLANMARKIASNRQLPVVDHINQVVSPTAAWETALKIAEPGQLICITGSFFIAAELRELIADRSQA